MAANLKPCTCSLVVAVATDGTERTTRCTATTKRTFAPGHDARLKGFLIRAGRDDMLVRVGDDVNTSAQAVADQFGFGYMVAEGIAREAKPRKVAKVASRTVVGKVGRWTYEGTVTAGGKIFAYTDRQGRALMAEKFTIVG